MKTDYIITYQSTLSARLNRSEYARDMTIDMVKRLIASNMRTGEYAIVTYFVDEFCGRTGYTAQLSKGIDGILNVMQVTCTLATFGDNR